MSDNEFNYKLDLLVPWDIPIDYQVDVFIDHLDRNGATIKSYTLCGCICYLN